MWGKTTPGERLPIIIPFYFYTEHSTVRSIMNIILTSTPPPGRYRARQASTMEVTSSLPVMACAFSKRQTPSSSGCLTMPTVRASRWLGPMTKNQNFISGASPSSPLPGSRLHGKDSSRTICRRRTPRNWPNLERTRAP